MFEADLVLLYRPHELPLSHGHTHGLDGFENLDDRQARLEVWLLEAGIIFHSIMIGVMLGATGGSPWIPLLCAIVFHQSAPKFEGCVLLQLTILQCLRVSRSARGLHYSSLSAAAVGSVGSWRLVLLLSRRWESVRSVQDAKSQVLIHKFKPSALERTLAIIQTRTQPYLVSACWMQ